MKKRNGGFSLVEVLVAIVLLGAMAVPICTSLVVSLRVNDKTDAMLQAQLEVSSAVEHLMAEGVTDAFLGEMAATDDPDDVPEAKTHPSYPGIIFVFSDLQENAYFNVTVTDDDALVEVTTSIRKEADS